MVGVLGVGIWAERQQLAEYQVQMITRAKRLPSADSLMPTFGVFALLTFCFVVFSQKLPLGEVAVIASLLVAISRPGKISVPFFFGGYFVYFAIGILGWPFSDFMGAVANELLEVGKVLLIGLAACNILTTNRDCRTFTIGYLALFALFPVRGALYNYVNGITEQGRISWNFFFNNPNDLAITCFLPIGLCGYIAYVEKGWTRRAAIAGLVVLIGILLLTQSRGAIIGLGIAIVCFVIWQRTRLKALVAISIVASISAAFAPDSVWERLSGLSNANVNDMSEVDAEGSASARWAIMGIGVGIASTNPLLGSGIGTYQLAHAQHTANRSDLLPHQRGFRDAHSTPVRTAAETGLFGLAAIVVCMMGSIIGVGRNRRLLLKMNLEPPALALLALQCSMIAYLIAALFNSAERSTFFILQFVVPWALAQHLTKKLGAGVTTQQGLRMKGSLHPEMPRQDPKGNKR
jgi:hypothetical protein